MSSGECIHRVNSVAPEMACLGRCHLRYYCRIRLFVLMSLTKSSQSSGLIATLRSELKAGIVTLRLHCIPLDVQSYTTIVLCVRIEYCVDRDK